jgi:hypothetical protein
MMREKRGATLHEGEEDWSETGYVEYLLMQAVIQGLEDRAEGERDAKMRKRYEDPCVGDMTPL